MQTDKEQTDKDLKAKCRQMKTYQHLILLETLQVPLQDFPDFPFLLVLGPYPHCDLLIGF